MIVHLFIAFPIAWKLHSGKESHLVLFLPYNILLYKKEVLRILRNN